MPAELSPIYLWLLHQLFFPWRSRQASEGIRYDGIRDDGTQADPWTVANTPFGSGLLTVTDPTVRAAELLHCCRSAPGLGHHSRISCRVSLLCSFITVLGLGEVSRARVPWTRVKVPSPVEHDARLSHALSKSSRRCHARRTRLDRVALRL